MMPSRWMLHISTFCASLIITACAVTTPPAAPPAAPLTSEPPSATTQTVQKVVALTPLTADLVARLDASKLVGIPGSKLISGDPRFQNRTIVSAERTPPNLEKIVALKPNLVIGAAGFHDQTLAKLEQLGIDTLTTEVNRWEALAELTQTLARSLDADPKPLLDRYQTCLTNLPPSPRSTLVLVSRQPILSPNKASWAGDLLTQFKVKNLAAELQGESPMRGYVTLSPEKILQANPEVIILVDTSSDILAQFKTDTFWKQLQAVKNDRVYVFDYYGLVNPGSIEQIDQACTRLKQALAPD
jgi:iron complex transport system substrate-binding protein